MSHYRALLPGACQTRLYFLDVRYGPWVLLISGAVYDDDDDDDADGGGDDEQQNNIQHAYSPNRHIPSTCQGSNPSPGPWSVEKARSASCTGWRNVGGRMAILKMASHVCNLVKTHVIIPPCRSSYLWNKNMQGVGILRI